MWSYAEDDSYKKPRFWNLRSNDWSTHVHVACVALSLLFAIRRLSVVRPERRSVHLFMRWRYSGSEASVRHRPTNSWFLKRYETRERFSQRSNYTQNARDFAWRKTRTRKENGRLSKRRNRNAKWWHASLPVLLPCHEFAYQVTSN